MNEMPFDGQYMHDLARRLWPIHRSITGEGVRQTLAILQEELPGLTIHEVPTGTQAFDWTVPDEWTIRGAQLIGPDGEIVVDYANSNLHVVGYSDPVDAEFDAGRPPAAPPLDPRAAGRDPVRHQLLPPHLGLLPPALGTRGPEAGHLPRRDRRVTGAGQPHVRRADPPGRRRRTRSSCRPTCATRPWPTTSFPALSWRRVWRAGSCSCRTATTRTGSRSRPSRSVRSPTPRATSTRCATTSSPGSS